MTHPDQSLLPAADIAGLGAALASGRCSCVEIVERCLSAIETIGAEHGLFLTTCPERALDEATDADRRRRAGHSRGMLDGIPVAIKDLQDTAGVRTTYGSLHYADHVPVADAPAVARLREAGMIVVGKTNTSPWGTLGETKNRLAPPARHPDDPELTTGGSSGGSAAAVALGIVPLATGTDCAGSVSAPAAMCGVLGVKAGRGRIPAQPVDDSQLLNDTGCFTRTALDAALAIDAMVGWHPADPLSIRSAPPRLAAAVHGLRAEGSQPLSGLRVLVCPEPFEFPIEPDAREAPLATAGQLEQLGAHVELGPLPFPEPFAIYMPLYATDFRRAFGMELDGCALDLYDETRQDLAEAPPISAEAYVGLLAGLWQLRNQATTLFERYDVVLTPATATAPFRHDTPPEVIGGRHVRPGWASFMPYSVVWNMTGQPTASVPGAVSAHGLPLGTLVVTGHEREVDLLRVAAALEQR